MKRTCISESEWVYKTHFYDDHEFSLEAKCEGNREEHKKKNERDDGDDEAVEKEKNINRPRRGFVIIL